MTKIFFDTEFTGLHQDTTLISIGIITDEGKTFYAELTDYSKNQCDKWIDDNVIKNLYNTDKSIKQFDEFIMKKPSDVNINDKEIYVICNMKELKDILSKWLDQYKKIEVWSDCLSYDWVLFNQIFGHAFELPKNIYYIPFDICTLFKMKDIDPDISREKFAEISKKDIKKHNSLFDAKIIKICYDKLIKIKNN